MSISPLNRLVSILALIVGPASLIITSIVQWTLQPVGPINSPADVAAQFPVAWVTIGILSVFGPIVWLAGVPATVLLAPARGAAVTSVGALVTGLGLGAGVGHLALYFGTYGSMAASGLSDGSLHRLAVASDADALSNVLLIVFLIAFAAGPIALTVGLRIAKAVPVWVPIAALVTAVANFLGGPIAGIVQMVALIAVWAPIVVAVLRAGREKASTASQRSRLRIPGEI